MSLNIFNYSGELDSWVRKAISISNKFMDNPSVNGKPTKEQWSLALLLFEKRLRDKDQVFA